MNKINWKRKLSSRKFWAALLAWLTSLLAVFNIEDSTGAQFIVLIVSGIGSLCVYILAEGLADCNRAKSDSKFDEVIAEANRLRNNDE